MTHTCLPPCVYHSCLSSPHYIVIPVPGLIRQGLSNCGGERERERERERECEQEKERVFVHLVSYTCLPQPRILREEVSCFFTQESPALSSSRIAVGEV